MSHGITVSSYKLKQQLSQNSLFVIINFAYAQFVIYEIRIWDTTLNKIN